MQGQAAITVEKLLCMGPTQGAGLTSVGLWCPISPPRECAVRDGGWVAFPTGLKLSTGRAAGSGAPGDVQVKVNPAQATQCELQVNLQVVATCARLGGAQASCH